MPRRSRTLLRIGGSALVLAIAVVVSPDFMHGQNTPGREIDGTQFVVSTKGPDGEWTSRETDSVPLRPREACYRWRLHLSNNTPGKLSWREEFTLPGKPGKAPTVLVTKKSEAPQDGWLGHEWCVARGDPVGQHEIRVYVKDSLAKAFTFFVVRPEDLARQATPPPRDSLIHAACLVVYVDEFKQEGHDEQKAQVMASLLCRVVTGGCQQEPRGQPCKNSIRHLSENLGKSGRSLPVMAARLGRTDLINTLIEVGADIDKPADLGWTPLMFAAAEGHPETVSALIKGGANVNATNTLGRTALMFASSYGFTAIVEDLLAHRADPNNVPNDDTGWTALMAAAHKGHIDVIRALLDHGADATIKDREGKTALVWAEAQGHADVARMLREATITR